MKSVTFEKANEVLKLVKDNGFPRAKIILWDEEYSEVGYHDFEDFDMDDGQRKVVLLGIELNDRVAIDCEFKQRSDDEDDGSEHPCLTISDV